MTSRQRVLICDDEAQILRALRIVLGDAGFAVEPAMTGEEALDAAALKTPDAAIIDLVLPDIDGVEVCRQLREWSSMPILLLSAVGDESEKVRALEAGADDYITKPFGSGELLARLRAVMRRAAPAPEEAVIIAGDLEVDVAGHAVRRGGEPVHLTPIEFDLLRELARNRGRLMTHAELTKRVWGPGFGEDIRALRTHVARLRAKVEPGPEGSKLIETEPGIGYRFAA